MAKALQYRRAHYLILLQRLLSARDAASPFTLIIDSLEQSGKPLVQEFIHRAKVSKHLVIFVSLDSASPPSGVDRVVRGRRKGVAALQSEIFSLIPKASKALLILSSLNPLACSRYPLSSFLSALLSPSIALVAIYHVDIPLPVSPVYAPLPLTVLKYLATSIFTVHSFAQILERRLAENVSREQPVFGLAEDIEGVVVGRKSNDSRGIVIDMEYRRKSGREVTEVFFLPAVQKRNPPSSAVRIGPGEKVMLLEDHPLYGTTEHSTSSASSEADSTFNLSLTEKQRRDREGVVLPYFDAQREGSTGQGGRILYDIGLEDDFDEEEDEI